MFDLRALSSGHEVEQVEMEDERSESHKTQRPKRIPSPVLPSSEEIDEHNILRRSQYRSWYPHCVVGSKVGRRQVASEEKSGGFPMTMMDYLGRGV